MCLSSGREISCQDIVLGLPLLLTAEAPDPVAPGGNVSNFFFFFFQFKIKIKAAPSVIRICYARERRVINGLDLVETT